MYVFEKKKHYYCRKCTFLLPFVFSIACLNSLSPTTPINRPIAVTYARLTPSILNKEWTFNKLDFSTNWNGAGSMCRSLKLTGSSISRSSHSLCSSRVRSARMDTRLDVVGEPPLLGKSKPPKSQFELVRLLLVNPLPLLKKKYRR